MLSSKGLLGSVPLLLVVVPIVAIMAIASAPVRAALAIYVTPEELAERSSHVVEATVRNVRSGQDPATGALATYITLEVTRLLHGPTEHRDVETLIVREHGGAIDGLVHAIDAVPVYRRGERVIAFLSPANDGALRTTGMFFGKYVVDEATGHAARDLDGRGTIVGRPTAREERVATADLASIAVTARRQNDRPALAQPAELDSIRWARPADAAGRSASVEKFAALSASNPTRWQEGATGASLTFDVERARNPLGDGALAAFQIERALAAWTDVPESRVVVVPGNTNASFTPAQSGSPASVYPPSNIVLFGDPYGDISDPNTQNCSGVLAVGGYWRSGGSAGIANGVSFNQALRGYVIFNNNFECFLGNTENLAEVATHEIGHALGFGHSTESDAIMRASAYGGRGPRLGDDDRDIAHCHYPHTLTLDAPSGGETAAAASTLPIEWSVTAESGADPGVVRIEAAFDGGPWELVADDVTNDGYYGWLVPERASTDVRVRVVRPNRAGGWESPYPSACSASAPSGAFAVTVPTPSAGILPSSVDLTKAAGGDLRISWSASCSGDVDDHAVYSGDLHALRAGSWNMLPMTCSAGADLVEYVTPAAGDRYYLVAPMAAGLEAGFGTGTGRVLRPRSPAACGVADGAPACN